MRRIVTILSYMLAGIIIVMGGLIYICYRPLSLVMFAWSKKVGCYEWLISIRELVSLNIPNWIIYALPDGLWCCSYIIFVGTIWNFDLYRCWTIAIIIPTIGIISELLQRVHILSGYFDWYDLSAYFLGGIVGLSYVYIINKYINRNENKI